MPIVTFVKKARKSYKAFGIKKGDSYYHWAFRFGPKYKSLTAPKRQQLTRSGFLKSLYDLEDRIEALQADDSIRGDVESIIEDIRALAEEQEDNKSNMPEGLQEGDTGQLLDERKEGLEEWADELEGLDLNVDEDEITTEVGEEKAEEAIESAWQEKLDEIQGCSHSL